MKEQQKHWWKTLLLLLSIIAMVSLVNLVYKAKKQICPDSYVDWGIAVKALSQHYGNLAEKNKEVDFGPIEIERHFAENCEEDLKIYDEYLYILKNKCPNDFINANDRFTSFNEWEKEFRVNNPNTSVSDLAKARKEFYLKNSCKEATQRPIPKDYGIERTDETTQQLLNIIENYEL